MSIETRLKTPEQVAAIQEVVQATETGIAGVLEYLSRAQEPTSEEAHDIFDEILSYFECESPEGHIVAGGILSAEPHEKGSGPLKRSVPIVIDVYPRSKRTGYFADISRTVSLGAPSAELEKMYNAVLSAQELAIAMIRPGVFCIDIQRAVYDYFVSVGFVTSGKGNEFSYKEGFVHSVGHGVGLKVHEAPKIGRNSTDVLMEGDVITVEPGLYYTNIGGVRIEDMFLVTRDGYRALTHFDKTLVL